MFKSNCSWASSNLQITTFTKTSITSSKLNKIVPNQKEKEYFSSYSSNIYKIQGFQAVHGRTRPGTNTKIVKTNQNNKFLRNQLLQNDLFFFFSFIPFYLERPIQ